MTPPLELPHSCYLLLLALEVGETLDAGDGVLTLTLPGEDTPVPIPSLPAALDELESRGWIELVAGESAAVTERGRYWLSRWILKRSGVRLADCRNVHARAVRVCRL